jgi:RNA polymerase sigma-70 factor, ECF subfamily
MDNSEEHRLIRAAQGGDAHAFEALVNMHYETMYKMAFKWCGNATEAEDITQEACIKLARGLGAFKFESAFTSWLYRLVINTAKDWYKKPGRQASSDGLETASIATHTEEQIYASEVLAHVVRLPEGEKEALILVFWEGLSHKEAGKILGCKESTVSWRIHEARKKLGALLGKEQKYG